MNKRKLIYFLSAFVLIIGCYALNLSYSLFTQNITSENNVVDSTIPVLNAKLSTPSVTVEKGKEYLIKQVVTNNSSISINYGISTDNVDAVKVVKLNDNIYTSYGISTENKSLDVGDKKEIYLVVSNKEGNTDLTVNFTLNYNYSTINSEITKLTNIDNTEYYETSIPYSENKDSLAYNILENYVESNSYDYIELPFNIPTPEITGIADYKVTGDETSGELGLFQIEDDYGISYYYRGASTKNYVKLAGFIWRIVRINGDGSVRLILDGGLDNVSHNGEEVYKNDKLIQLSDNGKVAFNTDSDDNAYIGYMYGNITDATHKNEVDSTIKQYIDTFYEEYLISYQNYFSDSLFCNDKTISNINDILNTKFRYDENVIYYAAVERLYYDANGNLITIAEPSLKCTPGENNNYSRFTSKLVDDVSIINGDNTISINNDLKYPIALLTADELVLAGAWREQNANTNYYLYDGYSNNIYDAWWTMTPYSSVGSSGSAIEFNSHPASASLGMHYTQAQGSVRPVINLRSDLTIVAGDGTKDTNVGKGPYEVSLPN